MKRSYYPALYRAASDASRDGQKTYKRLVGVDLSLVVLGSVLAALGFLVPGAYGAAFAAVAAIVLVGSIVAKFVGQQRRYDKERFDGAAKYGSRKRGFR